MQEIQRRLDVGEQSKATTSIGGWGKYCWDCCSHRLLFSQRNMVCCKRTNALLWFVNIKLWKEIQLEFVGRHDKKAIFLRHFPDIHARTGWCYSWQGETITLWSEQELSSQAQYILTLETQYYSSQCVVLHLWFQCTLLCFTTICETKKVIHLRMSQRGKSIFML